MSQLKRDSNCGDQHTDLWPYRFFVQKDDLFRFLPRLLLKANIAGERKNLINTINITVPDVEIDKNLLLIEFIMEYEIKEVQNGGEETSKSIL